MKIVVCGGGQVGVGIARQLIKENNDVVIVEENEDVAARIKDSLEVSVVTGFPSHPNILEDAGLDKADMVIAVTISDEVNMVICQIAHSLFQVPMKIARVRKRNYLDPIWKGLYRKDHLPIDYIISPEFEVARTIVNRLHVPGAMDSMDFVEGKLKVTEVRCEGKFPLNNMSMADIRAANPNLFLSILAIFRDGKPFFPALTDKITEGDELFFVSEASKVKHIMQLFGHEEEEARKLVIVGGGNIGTFVARNLSEEEGLNVKVIEMSRDRAEHIAGKLDEVTVINGNALDREIMQEAGISNAETVIAVTDDDEVNILSCLLAKRNGCKTSVCLINKGRSYLPLISSLGIDVDVNPRETTVSSILQHIRKGKVRAANSLYSGSMEIIEIEAEPGATVVGQMLTDLELPDDIRISTIVNKEGGVFTPNKNTIIREHDRLLIICKTDKIAEVDRIFSDNNEYF